MNYLYISSIESWKNGDSSSSSSEASSSSSLLTSSSHVFHESGIYEFFSRNSMFHFLEGCKVSFSVMINSYISIFDLNRKLLPCRKITQRNFPEKNRRFRNRENMWWAWPMFTVFTTAFIVMYDKALACNWRRSIYVIWWYRVINIVLSLFYLLDQALREYCHFLWWIFTNIHHKKWQYSHCYPVNY